MAGALGLFLALPWALEVWGTWVAKKAPNPAHFLLTSGFYITPFLGVGVGAGGRDDPAAPGGARGRRGLQHGRGPGGGARGSFYARMSAQYVFVLLPWLAFLAAAPVAALGRRGFFRVPPSFGLAYLTLLVLPALANLFLYFTVAHGDRPRWREAYAFVQGERRPGDLVLGMEAPVGEYYLDPDPGRSDVRNWDHVVFLDRFRADLAGDWARYPRRAWLLVNEEQLQDWSSGERARFLADLARHYRLVRSFPVHVMARDLNVLVYLRE